MSFYNPQKNPFPFYELEGEVWTNVKPKWHRTKCHQCCYKHRILVGQHFFQLPIDSSIIGAGSFNSVDLRTVSDNAVVSNTTKQLNVFADSSGNKYLMIIFEIEQSMVGDEYYISVDSDQKKYYSEIFCVAQSLQNHIGIEWASSTSKVGQMIYALGFKHSINLEAKMVQREPELVEDTEEDGFGNEVATLQILKQGYEFSMVVPNFLAQALSAIPLHDMVNLINRSLGETSSDLNLENKYVVVNAAAELDGCNSFVEIQYVEETVTKTACSNDIVALNNPPVADIVWDDNSGTENRSCDVDDDCTYTLRSTELTSDPDGNSDTLEWQRSSDNGQTWSSLGGGTTKVISENIIGGYWYRLKATDTFGLIGYSEILRLRIIDVSEPSEASLILLDTLGSFCSPSGGIIKTFDISASANQTVRARFRVTNYFGSGFILTCKNRITEAVLFTWIGGPIGTTFEHDFNLSSVGLRELSLELCLNDCINTAYTTASVQMVLLDLDNSTETNENLEISRFFNCN